MHVLVWCLVSECLEPIPPDAPDTAAPARLGWTSPHRGGRSVHRVVLVSPSVPPPPPPRPSRSNSTRKGTHHVVKRPDQAGRRGPARGPTHLRPTRDTTVNPTTTRSYVEVVRGVAQRSGRPATVRGPPHVTRYILLPRAPTHPPQPPSAQQRHEGEGRGFVLRSPKDGLSAGTWRRKVVMCPRRGNDPASGHPRAHQPPLIEIPSCRLRGQGRSRS